MGERGQEKEAECDVEERVEAVPEGRCGEGDEIVHSCRPFSIASEALGDVILEPEVHAYVPIVQTSVYIRSKLGF